MIREVLRERFIETLTGLGESAGNGRLRKTIGWQDDTYWSVHAALIEGLTITAGRGCGGSVAFAARPKKATQPQPKPAPEPDLLAPTAAPAVAPKPAAKRAACNGATLGFEAQPFQAADRLRKNRAPSDSKHVALGLINLKHISLAFQAKRAALLADDPSAADDSEQYLAENVFCAPKEARWSHLQASTRQTAIGKVNDDATAAIEAHNPGLKGVLPKDYNRPALDNVMLGELIYLISGIATGEPGGAAKDLLGWVYEYFLGGFAGSEGKRGGEFHTPRSVVRVLVEMLEPYKGRVYDPCCGSGGVFVQSEKFVAGHPGWRGGGAAGGRHRAARRAAPRTAWRRNSLECSASKLTARPWSRSDDRFARGAARVRNKTVLLPLIAEVLKTRPRDAWFAALEAASVPCALVNDIGEVVASPQFAVTDMVQALPGGGPRLVSVRISFAGVQPRSRRGAPGVGEHDAAV